MPSSQQRRLMAHILGLSKSETFADACKEWVLRYAEITEEGDNCPCGHDIFEQCYIENIYNGNTTYVGNVCIGRFLDLNTKTLFAGLKRIVNDPLAAANEAVIDYANQCKLLTERDREFLFDTRRKQVLSDRQASYRKSLNLRILAQVRAPRRRHLATPARPGEGAP